MVESYAAGAGSSDGRNEMKLSEPLLKESGMRKSIEMVESSSRIAGSSGGRSDRVGARLWPTSNRRTMQESSDESYRDEEKNPEMTKNYGYTLIENRAKGDKASFATSVFNLTNNVAGSGLLTLSAGKASGATGWLPSICLCGLLAILSAMTFIMIGRTCELTGEKTFKGLWSQAFGSRRAYLVDSIIFVQCFLGTVIYIGLLGDIFSTLLQQAMLGLPTIITSRPVVIAIVNATVLFPLSLQQNLSSLGFTSFLGVGAILYTVIFMAYRALDGSYSIDASAPGKFIQNFDESYEVQSKPSFDGSTMWNLDMRSLVLVSNLGLAFIAHYNAPKFYHELEKKSTKTFSQMVHTAYVILAGIYMSTMTAGYATFGDSSRGNILLNYHPNDGLALVGKLATGLSVLFGFPLVSSGARDGFKNAADALGYPSISQRRNHVVLVVSMLAAASVIAIFMEDINVIAGFSGAAMGSFVVYICPAMIYSRIICKSFGKGSKQYKLSGRAALLFVPFGLFIAICGITMTFRSMHGKL
mmetsp:Transcript_16570/g.24854  ORF Transcript_16570/g.24854 Transcript_16570/m.24854 type:complete len:528 (+) Transcript_16570:271-1854(+)